MASRPDWASDGRDWPNRAASRFVQAAGLRWHVQVMGEGPVLLLLHGTGSATHSWRDVLPLLAERFTVVAPDLPGHGFSASVPAARLSLPAMSASVGALLNVLGLQPALAAGHSAGAAILLRMALDGRIAPRSIVSLNGALLPLGDRNAAFFSGTAKLLASLPFLPSLFAWRAADRGVAEQLLRNTGSSIDARGVDLYARVLKRSGHVAAALGMMAQWDLAPLLRDLPRLGPRLLLVTGARDRAVPPSQAETIRTKLPAARIETLPLLGHLAHEEAPGQAAEIITREAWDVEHAGGVKC